MGKEVIESAKAVVVKKAQAALNEEINLTQKISKLEEKQDQIQERVASNNIYGTLFQLTLQEAGGADSARPEEKLRFWYILVIQLTRKNLTFPK